MTLKERLLSHEADILKGALHRHYFHLPPCAKELGISLKQLKTRLKFHQIDVDFMRTNRVVELFTDLW